MKVGGQRHSPAAFHQRKDRGSQGCKSVIALKNYIGRISVFIDALKSKINLSYNTYTHAHRYTLDIDSHVYLTENEIHLHCKYQLINTV